MRKPPLITPPLLGDATSRRCSRWLGDRNCNADAVMHVLWDNDMENGFVCSEHINEIGAVWAYVQAHEVGPDCGMPESRWSFERNVCFCPGSLEAAEPVCVSVGEPTGKDTT